MTTSASNSRFWRWSSTRWECRPSSSPAPVGVRIAELAQRVRSIAADIQHVTRGLHPARLEYLGLVPAVRALCQDLEHYGLAIHVSETSWPGELPGATALTLYRVTQEALHNAAKHSGADAVWVRFEATDSLLKLAVSDAGVGFEPDHIDRIEGFGMMSMRQRLRGVGGSLLVKSAPGQGTRIQATLPPRVVLCRSRDRLLRREKAQPVGGSLSRRALDLGVAGGR